MASITIHNLDDSLKRCLRMRAAKHVAPWKKRPARSFRTLLRGLPPPSNLAAAIRGQDG